MSPLSAQLKPRHGLTLMELVIVLAILAAMATAATVATDRFVMQRRFDLSQQTLTAVRSAVLGSHGPGESTTGTKSRMEGFVADMGRLPLLIDDEPELQTMELWQNVRGVEPYEWKQSADDPEVWLSCGWRGPYVELPIGETRLLDGWGRPFALLTYDANGSPVAGAADDQLAGMMSLGSDGEQGVSSGALPLAGDLGLWLVEQGPQWLSDIHITVWQRGEDGERVAPSVEGTLTVRLFGPNPLDGSVASIPSGSMTGPFSTPPQISFAEIPIGPKVVRAYFEDSLGTLHKSVPLPIDISRSNRTSWELVLPNLEPAALVAPPPGSESEGGL